MEKVLKTIRCILAVMMLLGVVMMWLEDSEPTLADSRSSRRMGGRMMTLESISMNDFDAVLEGKLRAVAVLDDVQKTCEVEGMKSALVNGINVRGWDDSEKAKAEAAMLYNSWALQNAISCAPAGTTIYMPAGTYYFVSGHLKMAPGSNKNERHVIRPASNVSLVGAGTNENGTNTTLKVYSESEEFDKNVKALSLGESGKISGGVDMFFWNDYSAFNGRPGDGEDYYLKNSNYYDFIIDSEDSRGTTYNTSGKGFMINLFRDCEWDNMVVKNTDGTGFGVDAPINGKISNSRAEGCGKAATTTQPGASGFGIGTGYSDNESMVISNSRAIRNKKFGFFYEHQSRFSPQMYEATRAANDKAFRVTNSYAEGNLYNYGGMRANDVYYTNSTSVATGTTLLDVYFSDESRQVAVSGITISNRVFDDVNQGSYYAEAAYWAVRNGITNGVSARRFGVGQTIRRADAIVMFWRMADRYGKVLSLRNGNLSPTNLRLPNIVVCYEDVAGDAYYAEAVKWAHDKGITNGVKACSSDGARDGRLSPNRGITRAEFVTMLWRMAGSPSVGKVEDFSDVTDTSSWYYNAVQWAVARGITSGIGNNRFGPDYDCTREQAVAILYRYYQFGR